MDPLSLSSLHSSVQNIAAGRARRDTANRAKPDKYSSGYSECCQPCEPGDPIGDPIGDPTGDPTSAMSDKHQLLPTTKVLMFPKRLNVSLGAQRVNAEDAQPESASI